MEGSTQNGPTPKEIALDIYKAYLDDLGRIGGRHETLRTFYVSLISALFTFLSLAGGSDALFTIRTDVQIVVGIVGGLISIAWFAHMRAFSMLYQTKFRVLKRMEEGVGFPVQPFKDEAPDRLERVHVTWVDQAVAVVFVLLFVLLFFIKTQAQ